MKFSKKEARLKRAKKNRINNRNMNKIVLSVHKSSQHIYAQIIDTTQGKTLASASSLASKISNGGNIEAASKVGELIAKAASEANIKIVAFDRSGFKFHGRIKALATAARENGLEF